MTCYHGYIHMVPMTSKTSKAYVRAYVSILDFFKTLGHPISNLVLDNEDSAELRAFFSTRYLHYQFVPPSNHRANPAERSIRTAKNHFISLLSATHPSFPSDLWHKLLPIAELTLNHLRPWTPRPTISAYHGLHGHCIDFRAHPLHPPGQLTVTHSPPTNRASWAHHGVRSFYLGPALSHYRSHHVYVVKTGSDRVSDTLAHFPVPLFHFSSPDPLPPTPPSDSRPHPLPDGSDMLGLWFSEPELGVCKIVAVAQPFELVVGAGNRTDDDYLPPGWHQCLTIRRPSGTTERISVTEVARFLSACPHTPPPLTPPRAPPVPAPPVTSPVLSRVNPQAHSCLPGEVLLAQVRLAVPGWSPTLPPLLTV